MKAILPWMVPALALVVALHGAGGADQPDGSAARDKSGYDLFHPTPEALLRELDADRPDRSTSPHTLDAGHFQVEADAFRFSREAGGGETRSWGATDFRVGLTDGMEAQFFIPFYLSTRQVDAATQHPERKSGIGDLAVILKANFWGNESDEGAGGGAFFLKVPTASHGLGNGKVEGGALFLWETKLPWGFDLTFNTGAAVSANDDNGGHHADLLNVAGLGHDIAGPVSAFVEFFSSVPTRHSRDWAGTVDAGFTVKAGRDLQFDAGLNIGVTDAAAQLEPFVGLTARF